MVNKRYLRVIASVCCLSIAAISMCSCGSGENGGTINVEDNSISHDDQAFEYEASEDQVDVETTEEPTIDPEVEQMRVEIENVRGLIEKGKYPDAYSQINELTTRYGAEQEISELSEILEDLLKKAADEQVEKYFSSLDYSSARSYISEICTAYSYEVLVDKSDSLENDFADYVLNESESNAASGNYEAASAIVQTAIDAIGNDNEVLTNAYNEYISHLPVYLTALNYMSCVNCVTNQSNLKDNIGTLYHNGLFMHEDTISMNMHDYGEGSADYYINGKYTTFTGTVAVPSGNESTDKTAYFEVYGDGQLLYTSPLMGKSSFPETFEIDVNGVKLLKISYPSSNEKASMATIYDGLLTPVE